MNKEQEKLLKLFMEDGTISDIISLYGEWNHTLMWEKINERLKILLEQNS